MFQRLMINVTSGGGGESTIDAQEGTFKFDATSNYYEISVKQKPKIVLAWTEHTSSTDYNANSAMWIDNVQAYSSNTPRYIGASYTNATASQVGYGFSQTDSLSSLPTIGITSVTDSVVKFKKSTTQARWKDRDFKYLIIY